MILRIIFNDDTVREYETRGEIFIRPFDDKQSVLYLLSIDKRGQNYTITPRSFDTRAIKAIEFVAGRIKFKELTRLYTLAGLPYTF